MHLCSDAEWDIVRLAGRWKEGVLPGPGGVQEQSAWTVGAIEVVLATWSRMEAARAKREKRN